MKSMELTVCALCKEHFVVPVDVTCVLCKDLEAKIKERPIVAAKILNAANSEMVVLPRMPTEDMWAGLARDIIMWQRMNPRGTGKSLQDHLRRLHGDVPGWLNLEIRNEDYVPPKGSVAVAIYLAMLHGYEGPKEPAL